MKKILLAAILLSSCGESSVDSVIGTYMFQGDFSETSTCTNANNTRETAFVFEVLSDSEMTIDFALFKGNISNEKFNVSAQDTYGPNQTLTFFSDDVPSSQGSLISSVSFNPLCYAKFDGTFERTE